MDLAIINQLQARFGSADFSKYQVVRAQKYDFVRLTTSASGTNQISFFNVPVGGTDPQNTSVQKTLEQTNLVKSASFGQEFFAVTQIRTYAGLVCKARQSGATATNANTIFNGYASGAANAFEALNDLFHRGVLNIKLAQKLYWQLQQPFLTAPPGFGIDIQSMAAGTTGAPNPLPQYWITQDPGAENVFNVDPVQIIEPEVQIEATIDFPDVNTPSLSAILPGGLNANVEVGLIFDGYTIRPSQ